MTFSIEFNTVVDDDGFILFHIRDRIEDLATKGGNPRDFARQFAARCGLTLGDLAEFMRGQLSVSPERARRIEAALDAAEDRDCDSDLGGFDGNGGDGGLAALSADLDEMIAEPATVEDHRDEVEHQAEPATIEHQVEHQVEEDAAADEPAPVELEPIEPAEPILEDAVEDASSRRQRMFSALVSDEPVESVAIDEAEYVAIFAELDSIEPEPIIRRERPAPKSAPGTLDKTRRERAEKATAKVAARISVKNPHRGILQALRRERARRLTALRNACKMNAADPVFRKLAGREEEICDGWLAVAWARQRFGPDASFSQIAETMHELRVRAYEAERDDPKPTRRQAQTVVERTLALEAEGMPWQRYRTL